MAPWFWPCFFLVLWMVLLRAANPSLMTDGSGETVAAALQLGISHPPGYPLLSLLGRLAGFLPFGTPAFRLNLLSSMFLLSASFVLLKVCRETSQNLREKPRNPRGAISDFWLNEILLAATVLSLFFCESVFAQGLSARGGIYTLTLLNLAVLLAAVLKEPRNLRTSWILFFWSIGMGAHWPTQVLWLVFLLMRFHQSGVRWTVRKIAVSVTFVLLGLSVYLFLPLRAQSLPIPDGGPPDTAERFLSLVFRTGTLRDEFTLRSLASYGRILQEFAQVLFLHWWPGFILLALGGLLWLFARNRPVFRALATGYFCLAVMIVLTATFNEPDRVYLVGVMLVSTQAFLALFGYLGARAAGAFLSNKNRKAALAAICVVVLVALGWGARTIQRLDKSRYTLATDYAVNLFQELPRDAMVLTDDDVFDTSALYLGALRPIRKDVAWVSLYKLQTTGGKKQIAQDVGPRVISPGALTDLASSVRYLTDPARVRSSGVFYTHKQPVFETLQMTDIVYRLRPWGLSENFGNSRPSAQELSKDLWILAAKRRLRNLDRIRDLPGTEIPASFYLLDYSRPHFLTSALLLREGALYEAARHCEAALAIHPRIAKLHLNLATYYTNAGYHEIARTVLMKEFEASHDSPETYMAYGNIMMRLGLWDAAIAAFSRCIELKPDSPEAINNRSASDKLKSFPPPPEVVSRKKIAVYEALGRQYEEDGQHFLAGFAYETVKEMEKHPLPLIQ